MRRWRPSLAFVLFGALGGTLAVSFAGLVALRYLGPEIGFRQAAVLLAALITLVTAVLGGLLVRLLLRPIRALEAYARAHEAGHDAPPPRHYGTSETHSLARRVIAMATALRNREATIRAYTDHVTHELKTPVSALRAATELLEDGGALGPDDLSLVAQIDGARVQLERQLAALRSAAQARETRYLGQTTLTRTLAVLPDQPLTLHLTGGDTPLPLATEGLAVVLTQLLRNAQEHGATEVRLTARDRSLMVHDNGRGISAGNAPNLFQPFFTTRRDTGGTGMGLAITAALLNAHGAQIAYVATEAGACFEVTFAAAQT